MLKSIRISTLIILWGIVGISSLMEVSFLIVIGVIRRVREITQKRLIISH